MRAHIIGDLHGYYEVYKSLLLKHKIIDDALDWISGDDQLWLIGDIFDRGPDAIRCITLTIKLQSQAQACGGQVNCLLGNHELMFLAASHFADDPKLGPQFLTQWIRWGGQAEDLYAVTSEQVSWLRHLPAMALVGDRLLMHGDNLSYANYGLSIEQVNLYFTKLLESDDEALWYRTLNDFSARGAFELGISGPKQVQLLLKMYGGKELVHGHTPISTAVDIQAESVDSPRFYAGGRCCNVDGGIYLGSPGFVYSYDIKRDLTNSV